MPVSSSGAVKAFLEAPAVMGGAAISSAGIPVRIFRDEAPPKTVRPYVTVSEAITVIPDPLEDGAMSTVREHVTVDVWMDWKDLKTNTVIEDKGLAAMIGKALHGSRLLATGTGTPPTLTYSVLVNSIGPRVLEREVNAVHIPIWAEVWRAL